MKEIIELTPREILRAVGLWLRTNRPELSNRYEHIRGNLPNSLTFELYDEIVNNGENQESKLDTKDNKDNKDKDNKDNKDKEHKRLIRVDSDEEEKK